LELHPELQEAVNQYLVKQYDRAVSTFKKFSRLSNPVALYYMGMMNYHGYSLKQNDKEAYQYFMRARAERHPEATYMLGVMYEQGRYLDKDLEKAFEFFSAAFHDGHIESGIKVASYYEEGILEEKSPQKALEAYVECAKKDHPLALYKIGMAYLQGLGIKKSIESAHLWLNKALMFGSSDAMNQFRLLGSKSATDVRTTNDIYRIGKELYQQHRYTDSFIYFEIAAKEGMIEAYHQLSKMHDLGEGVEPSFQKGFEYLIKAAEKNDPEAFFILGKRYESGEGCASSFLKAESFYIRAKEKGHPLAENELKELRGDILA